MQKVSDDQDNVLLYCYAGQTKAVYTENMCVVSALFRLAVWIFVEFCKLAGIRSFRSMPSSTGDSMIRQRCEVAK